MKFKMSSLPSNIFNKPILNEKESAWIEHIPFAFLLVHLLKPEKIVELGTHYGTSYFAFCQAVKESQLSARCYAIDHWKGDEQAGFFDEDVFEYVKRNNETHFKAYSTLLKMPFDDALTKFEDHSIDLLHIDGLHTYEAVKNDFENWLPKMSDKGIVLLHDTQVKKEGFGVWRFFEELGNRYKTFEFSFGYGLGVIFTGNKIPKELSWYLNQVEEDQFLHNLFESLGRLRYLEYVENTYKKQSFIMNKGVAQLFYSSGETGFKEEKSIVENIDPSKNTLTFTFPGPVSIRKLRFDPLNDYAEVHIQDIILKFRGNVCNVPVNYSSNARKSLNTYYLFDTNDPQIYIDLENEKEVTVDEVVVELSFVRKGKEVLEFLIKN